MLNSHTHFFYARSNRETLPSVGAITGPSYAGTGNGENVAGCHIHGGISPIVGLFLEKDDLGLPPFMETRVEDLTSIIFVQTWGQQELRFSVLDPGHFLCCRRL